MKKLLQMKFMLLLCALIVGSGTMWADTKTEGFETKAATTTYNGTVSVSTTESDCGLSWQIYYGTVSTNDKISGSKSAQMRWYSSATSNYPYIMTTTPVDGLSKVSLKARTSSTDVKMDLSYSADGTTWTVGKTYTFTNFGVGEAVSLDIPSGNKYVKFGVSSSSTAPSSGNYKLIVDDVEFTYSTGPSISANDATVSWNAEGGNIEYTISNPLNPEWEQVMLITDTGDNWLQSGSYGSNGELPFTVSTNYGDERSATVTLSYSYVIAGDNTAYQVSTTATVTQTAKPAPIITVQQDSYTMGKDDTSIQIPYSIENADATSFLSVGFDGNANWTSLNKEIDYEHDIITITTDANSGPERTVNVVLGYPGAENKTVTLTQEGVIWPTVSYQANPAEGATQVYCCDASYNPIENGSMVEPGSKVYLMVTPADNYEFLNWTVVKGNIDIPYPTNTSIEFLMPEDDVEIVANLKSNLSEEWVETTLADLTENDVFVIVGNNGNTYAMANDGGTTSAPSAVGVTIEDNKITSDVADNIQWNISGDATNGYTFYPNGSTTTWLYCTNTNNGVRVGTNDNNDFVIKDDYLFNTATSRYIGIYQDSQTQNWRCYTSINANIKDETFAFYKKVSTAPDERAEAGLAFEQSEYSVELVNAASFNSPVLSNPNELSPITWTSSNEEVATVENGTVTIKALGETTIKASFAGDENYKKGEASYTLTVQDSRQVLELSFEPASVEVNVNETVAAPTLNGNAGSATVTYVSDDETIATVDVNTGEVTGVADGTTTITATVAATNEYKEGTATFTVTVIDPNKKGSVNNPYTVAEARAAIDAGTGLTNVYATGIVSEIVTAYSSQFKNITYNISADGSTTSDQLQAYRGKGIGGADFTSEDDIKVGDVVVIYGDLKKHNNSIYEFDSGNQLVSLKLVAPTFYPEAGGVASGTEITISDLHTTATIYYTTNGDTPTASSTEYNSGNKPVITAPTTIKAIAVKAGYTSSDVVTASYTILSPAATPTFSPEGGIYTSAQSVTISSDTEDATIYYTLDSSDPTTSSIKYTEAIVVDETVTIKAIAVKEGMANSAVATATYTMNIPSIDAEDVDLTYNTTAGSIDFTITNPAEGTLTAAIIEGNWLTLGTISDNAVAFTCSANEGSEDRTAIVKLTYTYDTNKTVDKEVTITQAYFDFAQLPFTFNGGRADIEETDGLTQEGLGTDYNANANNNPTTKLKFDSTGDWMILTINEIPGTLTFDIKGNSFSGGTFKVQTSADGTTYTDLATYKDLGDTQTETFNNLAANVRYIKWIYTNKSTGNVGLGNITLGNTMAVAIAAACTDGTKCYSTFSSSKPFIVPEDLTVSEIGIEDGTMNVVNYATGETVPANTGVMVSATDGGNYVVNISKEAGTSVLDDENRLRPTGDNSLTATEMTSAEPETCKFYRLTMHGAGENNPGKIGFWWGNDGGNSFDIAANKAYLAVPASVAGARNGFAFGDDATGISNVNVNLNDNDNCYDLQGRRINNSRLTVNGSGLKSGIYIVNGKKVVIK